MESVLGKELRAFRYKNPPRDCEYRFDDDAPVKDVGALIIFRDVAPACEFMPGAVVVGAEKPLRKYLAGRKFFPRAAWRDLVAVEIAEPVA